jgi:hypothetical protein
MRGDARPALGQAHTMILTELGPHFARDGDGWVCVELPGLRMTRDCTYHVDGHVQVFVSLKEAAQHLTGPAASQDIS